MKKINTFIFVAVLPALLLIFSLQTAKAQTIIYQQNFDDTTALPTGWTTEYVGDTAGNLWSIDTANSSYTPNGNGGYAGASGKNSAYVRTDWHHGQYLMFTALINASQYENITVEWGARYTPDFGGAGSVNMGFWWSPDDGNNWDSIPYTEVPQDGYWHLENNSTQIALPSYADYHYMVFNWGIEVAGSQAGSYHIDDFILSGTNINSVAEVKDKPQALVYVVNNSTINIVTKDIAGQQLTVELLDMVGNTLSKEIMTSETFEINASSLATGIYLVKITNGKASEVTKVAINR